MGFQHSGSRATTDAADRRHRARTGQCEGIRRGRDCGQQQSPDWFPEEHPPAPRVVAGPAPNACGSCHLMSGQGHPESADMAGLPVEYFIRQMNDFKTGARREVNRMEPIARALSDEDVRLAAEYYAALTPTPFVDVIETATPPKTYVSINARHRVLSPEGGTEPMGRRIVQIPKDPFRTNIRDPKSDFIAYVPPGSIRRGEELVKTGGGIRCRARSVTATRSRVSATCRASRACSPFTSRGSSSACKTARAPARTPRP